MRQMRFHDASEVGFHVRQKLIITCFHMFAQVLVLFEPSLSPCFEPFPLAFEFEMVRGDRLLRPGAALNSTETTCHNSMFTEKSCKTWSKQSV